MTNLKKWQETKRAVVTDARLTLAGTNVTLRMGTELPAKEESEGILMVSIPQKDDKGQLVITNVETAQDGIHFGYLDMTKENILDQAEKVSWNGLWLGRFKWRYGLLFNNECHLQMFWNHFAKKYRQHGTDRNTNCIT